MGEYFPNTFYTTTNKFELMFPCLARQAETADRPKTTQEDHSKTTQDEGKQRRVTKGNMDDPTSISSFVGLRVGTNGYGAIFQLGLNDPDSRFAHNSFLQFIDDFDTVWLRHFSVYKPSGTGVFVDAKHDDTGPIAVNRASVGAIQIIPVGDSLRINPAILYGETWTDDSRAKRTVFPYTAIATLYSFVRWTVTDGWFVDLIPQYTYSVNGRKIRLFEMVTQLWHDITPRTSMAVSANEDDEVWLTIRHAF